MTTLLTVAQVASRSGFAPSALRFYEREGLLAAQRTAGRQRRYERIVLRRLAFIRAARNVGLSLDEIREELAHLPDNRAPTSADWRRISRNWRGGSMTGSPRSRRCGIDWIRASAAGACRSRPARCTTRRTDSPARWEPPGAALTSRAVAPTGHDGGISLRIGRWNPAPHGAARWAGPVEQRVSDTRQVPARHVDGDMLVPTSGSVMTEAGCTRFRRAAQDRVQPGLRDPALSRRPSRGSRSPAARPRTAEPHGGSSRGRDSSRSGSVCGRTPRRWSRLTCKSDLVRGSGHDGDERSPPNRGILDVNEWPPAGEIAVITGSRTAVPTAHRHRRRNHHHPPRRAGQHTASTVAAVVVSDT